MVVVVVVEWIRIPAVFVDGFNLVDVLIVEMNSVFAKVCVVAREVTSNDRVGLRGVVDISGGTSVSFVTVDWFADI